MTSDKSFFETLRMLKQQVFQADGAAVYTDGIGEGWLHCRLPEGKVQPIQLKNVFYVPAVKGNLLSVRLIKSKSEVTSVIKEYVARMKNRFGRSPTAFRTDNGGEYLGSELSNFFNSEGIQHETTVPYTPQQNGVAERKNRSLTEMAKCMLLDTGLHNRLWGEAADLGHIRVFGAKVFSLVAEQKRQKWDDKAVEGMLVGYDDPTKGYRILNPETGRTWVSRSVKIIERTERKEDEAVAEQEGEMEKKPTSENLDDRTFSELPRLPDHAPQFTETQHTGQHDVSSHASPTVSLRRSQRINKGIPQRRLCYQAEIQRKTEPSCWDEMERLLAAEKRKWITAAEEEMNSLRNYRVRELVDLPPGKKTVFKAKLDSQGRICTYKTRLVARGFSQKYGQDYDETYAPVVKHETVRALLAIAATRRICTYKTRLVARGFSQKYGQDYDETYAPVVKHETVRALLAIAATRKLHVRCEDVKNAYLNGDLEEELYMEQPPGFVEKGKEHKVLLLKKSIYGLKQSARCWNRKASETLGNLGYTQSQADQCLFIKKGEMDHIYILLYVDDLLVVGRSETVNGDVGRQMNAYFNTRDLGKVSYYLGIEVTRRKDGSFLLSQRSKITELLNVHGMQDCKPAATPMEICYLDSPRDESTPLPNNSKYRQAIGSLLYLTTVSRPDVANGCRPAE
ncbi:hypothetical protein M514_26361 [Trichuris suis]|uniref:Integrase catalytic domain-containing protein n=1 Tax=Trichuris suis TaxID=68888 RepID=A0A085MW69_9BILA|nr:hypothetical protein M514_26361 [Trichuris suis]